jgi:hypothetical protein
LFFFFSLKTRRKGLNQSWGDKSLQVTLFFQAYLALPTANPLACQRKPWICWSAWQGRRYKGKPHFLL